MQQHVGANLKKAIGVLPLMIDLDSVGVVFDHSHRQTLITQARNDALEEGGLARILEAANGNDGWRRRPTRFGAGLEPSGIDGAETIAQWRMVWVQCVDLHPPI
jgi:hypothetical protein